MMDCKSVQTQKRACTTSALQYCLKILMRFIFRVASVDGVRTFLDLQIVGRSATAALSTIKYCIFRVADDSCSFFAVECCVDKDSTTRCL